MQLKFVVLFLLVGASFAQGLNPPQHYVDKGIVDDLIAKAKEAINKLIELVSGPINSALEFLKDMGSQISDLANQAIAAAKEQFDKIVGDATAMIDEMIQKAQDLGIDVSECVSDNKQQFQDLFDKFIASEMHCVQKEMDSAMKYVGDVKEIIDGLMATVSDLPAKLQDCIAVGGWGIATCIGKVVTDAIGMQTSLPGKIAGLVKEVSEYIGGLKVRLAACASTELLKAGEEAAGIVADVAKCISEKRIMLARLR